MKVKDIKDYETTYITHSNSISIFGILNSVKNFEAINVNMIGNKHYFISIIGEKLEEEKYINNDDFKIINEYITSIGGKQFILNHLQNIYDSKPYDYMNKKEQVLNI